MIHVVTNIELCLCSISCEIIGGFDLVLTLIFFYDKTSATTKINTVAGYHVGNAFMLVLLNVV